MHLDLTPSMVSEINQVRLRYLQNVRLGVALVLRSNSTPDQIFICSHFSKLRFIPSDRSSKASKDPGTNYPMVMTYYLMSLRLSMSSDL